jgi:HJR/Mrr/RecB family endonuclease/uncharacterized protein YecT (DUF1311 family)
MTMRFVLALAAFVLVAISATDAAAQGRPAYYCDPLHVYSPPYTGNCPVPWRAVYPPTAAPQPSPAPPASQEPIQSVPQAARPNLPALGDGLDDWCKTVALPSSVAICSDRELRALVLERQRAYDGAKAGLSPKQQEALLADQNGWVKTYPLACGLAQDTPPSLPLAPAIKDCMAEAARARIAYLRSYGLPGEAASATAPSASTTDKADQSFKCRDPRTNFIYTRPPPCVEGDIILAGPVRSKAPAPAPDRSSGSNPFIIIGVLVIVAVITIFSVKKRVEKLRRDRASKHVAEIIAAKLVEHQPVLVRKRFQTLQHDEYGNILVEPWQKQIDYFIERVIVPAVRSAGIYEFEEFLKSRFNIPSLIYAYIEQHVGQLGDNLTFGPNFSSTDFEHYCADRLRRTGWTANTTKASGDQGVDIIAEKGGLRLVVQCKFYNHPVGNRAVQEVAAARTHERADCAAVVSNARYTPLAKELAATNNVLLLHHTDLQNIDDLLGE